MSMSRLFLFTCLAAAVTSCAPSGSERVVFWAEFYGGVLESMELFRTCSDCSAFYRPREIQHTAVVDDDTFDFPWQSIGWELRPNLPVDTGDLVGFFGEDGVEGACLAPPSVAITSVARREDGRYWVEYVGEGSFNGISSMGYTVIGDCILDVVGDTGLNFQGVGEFFIRTLALDREAECTDTCIPEITIWAGSEEPIVGDNLQGGSLATCTSIAKTEFSMPCLDAGDGGQP